MVCLVKTSVRGNGLGVRTSCGGATRNTTGAEGAPDARVCPYTNAANSGGAVTAQPHPNWRGRQRRGVTASIGG